MRFLIFSCLILVFFSCQKERFLESEISRSEVIQMRSIENDSISCEELHQLDSLPFFDDIHVFAEYIKNLYYPGDSSVNYYKQLATVDDLMPLNGINSPEDQLFAYQYSFPLMKNGKVESFITAARYETFVNYIIHPLDSVVLADLYDEDEEIVNDLLAYSEACECILSCFEGGDIELRGIWPFKKRCPNPNGSWFKRTKEKISVWWMTRGSGNGTKTRGGEGDEGNEGPTISRSNFPGQVVDFSSIFFLFGEPMTGGGGTIDLTVLQNGIYHPDEINQASIAINNILWSHIDRNTLPCLGNGEGSLASITTPFYEALWSGNGYGDGSWIAGPDLIDIFMMTTIESTTADLVLNYNTIPWFNHFTIPYNENQLPYWKDIDNPLSSVALNAALHTIGMLNSHPGDGCNYIFGIAVNQFEDSYDEAFYNVLTNRFNFQIPNTQFVTNNRDFLTTLFNYHWEEEYNAEFHAYFQAMIDLKVEEPEAREDRMIELWLEVKNNPNFLIEDCLNQDPDVDLSFWSELYNLIPSQEILSKLSSLGYSLQNVEDASGARINLDYFGIHVSQMPFKPNSQTERFTPDELIEHVRLNLDDFQSQIGTSFAPIAQDAALWNSSNPLSSIVTISILPDDGSVVTSSFANCCWVFSTIKAPSELDGYHPVSGNRQFGWHDQNMDGVITFYTKGVDRVSNWYHYLLEDYGYSGGEALWESMEIELFQFINSNGGSAVRFPMSQKRSHRPRFEEIRSKLKSAAPINGGIPCH